MRPIQLDPDGQAGANERREERQRRPSRLKLKLASTSPLRHEVQFSVQCPGPMRPSL